MKIKILRKCLENINVKIDSLIKIQVGAVRNTYLIKSNKRKFILKIFDKEKKKDIQNLINNLRKINKKEVITINPIHSKVLSLDKKVGFIYDFFEGKGFNKIKTKNKLYKFGKIVGKFNKTTLLLLPKSVSRQRERINSSIKNNISNIQNTISFLKRKPTKYSNKTIKLLEEGIFIIKEDKIKPELRISLIHGDLHYENILYNSKNNTFLIIDVFGMKYDYLIDEIEVIISHLITNSTQKNKKIIKGILKGYESLIKLKSNEKRMIPFFILLHKMGEVNWLINQHNKSKISKQVFNHYMNTDLKQLKIIINQYENVLKLLQ